MIWQSEMKDPPQARGPSRKPRTAGGPVHAILLAMLLFAVATPLASGPACGQAPVPDAADKPPAGAEPSTPGPDLEKAPSSGAEPTRDAPLDERAGAPRTPDAAAAPTAKPVAQDTAPALQNPSLQSPASAVPTVAPSPDRRPDERAAAVPATSTAPKILRLVSKAGAYRESQKKSVHAAFTAASGISVSIMPWPVSGTPLDELKAGKAASWDLAEIDGDAAGQACEAGLLERIDPSALAPAPDGAAIDKDYIAGGVTPCAVASVAWSSLVAFDRRAWPDKPRPATRGAKKGKDAPPAAARVPDDLKDLFDVATFPGKRALRRNPRHLLEMSLIADGAAPEEVYRLLGGDAGAHRAFRRLEALRSHVVWVETPAAASKALADRTAVMAMVFNGRAFQHVAVESKPYGLIWDGQIYHLESWVVAKGSSATAARGFLAVASDPARQAEQAAHFPYGPPRASAVARVGRHPVLNIDMIGYLPTAPANLRTALQFDAAFWRTHGPRLTEMFEAWLKAPLPAPVEQPATRNSPAGEGSAPAARSPG